MNKTAVFFECMREGCKGSGISIREGLEMLKKEGLDMIYLERPSIEKYDGDLLGLFRELDLPVEGFHEHCNFADDPDSETYKSLIDLAAAEHANNVLLVPGFVEKDQEAQREQRMQNMFTVLRRAVAYGQEKGIDVCMEDYDAQKAPFCTSEGLKCFLDNVPGLKAMPDTGNFLYEGDALHAFEVFRHDLCGIHLKDRSRTQIHEGENGKMTGGGTIVYPCAVGSGDIDIAAVIRELKEDGYQGNFILEMFDIKPEFMLQSILDSIHWLKGQLAE